MNRLTQGVVLALLLPALAWPPLIGAEPIDVEEGDWFGTLKTGIGSDCTLNTGGYDRVDKTQHPALSLTLRQRDDDRPRRVLTATAVTTLSRADLARLRLTLRVIGRQPMSLRAVPSALTETSYDRRLTLRPVFPGDDDEGMQRLIAAMRVGERLVAEINGRPLEPAFSLIGFDALWRQAIDYCGAAADGH